MSGQNNNALMIGALALAFVYVQRRPQAMVGTTVRPNGAVNSMPGNVGTGWQQAASGAVAGFLQSLAKGPTNNTSQSYFPSTIDPMDAIRGDVAQEGVFAGDSDSVYDWFG
jgi:hypothetical protein